MSKSLLGKTISELQNILEKKEASATEIAQAHLKHIEDTEKKIAAFNTITADLALKQAKATDEKIAKKEPLLPLSGIPLAVKDNICLAGYPTTCSSKMLENFTPPYEATVTQRLSAAGATIIGKTNLDEFAMGSSTENSAFKITRNPWNTERVPGGSSGGSAASTASGTSVISLGSDTGGSIRQPASFCGIVGMKPTYGTVSRFGLVAFSSSLDQIGSFARSVKDVAITLDVMGGHDPLDATSYNQKLPGFASELEKPIKGLRIGLIKELMGEGIDDDVRDAVLKAVETYKALGAQIKEVSMPNLRHALPVYYLICTADASTNLARFDGVRYGHRAVEAEDMLNMYFKTRQQGFGPEVKRRIMLGTYALSSGYYDAYYKKAQKVRRIIKNDFDEQFKELDLLLTPTSPSVAFAVGSKTEDPLSMYLSDIATIPANLAGIPGISIPCGRGKDNLPIGLQLLGPALKDAVVLQAAYAFEQATEFHKQLAEVVTHA